jgi:hypothetical protein
VKFWIRNLLILLVLCRSGFAQGFLNLNFEAAKIIPVIAGSPFIEITNALPGWSVFGTTQGQMTYNDPSTGLSSVSLWATNGQQISGNNSVLLQSGVTSPSAYISQTGLVPASSQSILFEAQPELATDAGSLELSLGGQDIPFFELSLGSNYALYTADISAFAGQTEQLMFSALKLEDGNNNWTLDNIQFSPTAVPEPSTFGLSALGGLFLAWCRCGKSPRT